MVVPRRTKKQPQQSLPQASRSAKYESILLLSGSPASPTDNKRMESGVKNQYMDFRRRYRARGGGNDRQWQASISDRQAGSCWLTMFSQPSSLVPIMMKQISNLDCRGALTHPCQDLHRNTAATTEKKGKGLRAEAPHWMQEADCIKFTYNREHTDITSSTILRQKDKEERQTEGTDKKDKSADTGH